MSSINLGFTIDRIYPLYVIASQTSGCFVECGVSYGRSALIIESIIQLKHDLRLFFLFDSFKGFPERSDEDLTGSYTAKKGQ